MSDNTKYPERMILGSCPETWHRKKLIICSDRTVFGFNTWTKRKDQIRCIQPAGQEEIHGTGNPITKKGLVVAVAAFIIDVERARGCPSFDGP